MHMFKSYQTEIIINCYIYCDFDFHKHAVVTETTTIVMTAELLPSTTELQFETKTGMITKTASGGIYEPMNTPPLKCTATCTSILADQSVFANQRETTTAWILFAMMSILFSGSFTINVIVLVFLVYQKRQVGGENGQRSEEYKVEGNPCYEATEMKQSCESEAHVYETVREKRAK